MALPFEQEMKRQAGGTLSNRYPHLPLWCEAHYALEKRLTIDQAIERHVRHYDFESEPTENFRANRLEHELSHMLLGLAFMRMGYHPIEYDFGTNGNYQVEALTLALEKFLHPDVLYAQSHSRSLPLKAESAFLNYYHQYYRAYGMGDGDTLKEALDAVNASPVPQSLFSARAERRFNFGPLTGKVTGLPETTKFGERLPRLVPLPDATVRNIFLALKPALLMLQDRIDMLFADEVTSATTQTARKERIYEALRTICVDELWGAVHSSTIRDTHALTHRHRTVFHAMEALHDLTGQPLTVDQKIDLARTIEKGLESGPLSRLDLGECFEHKPEDFEQKVKAFWEAHDLAKESQQNLGFSKFLRASVEEVFLKEGYPGFLPELEAMIQTYRKGASTSFAGRAKKGVIPSGTGINLR